MPSPRSLQIALPLLLAAASGCRTGFQPRRFSSNDALYEASLRELRARHWTNAIAGFERLTVELPARDPLFPRSLYHLGRSHVGSKENLLAAQSFARLAESFPNDSMADDALLEAGRAYGRMWRKPALDAQYGETALATYRTLVDVYPSSPLVAVANRETARLAEWFARKTYDNGMHYFRRKGYESSIIYFKDVVTRYPDSPASRDALLRLAESYGKIRYREDAAETCTTLHRAYPGDRQVREICGAVPDSAKTTVP
ncbi:MAG: outer membrane protein assembly factor BamD [Gemmatimonadaceae bacterium]